MNTKLPIIAVAIIIFIFLSAVYLTFFQKKAVAPIDTTQVSNPSQSTQEAAPAVGDDILKNALNLYIQKKAENTNFSEGPCLGLATEDWVVDIAHSPRQPQDDKAQNQCPDFREGRAHHFIELDPDGKLIKSQ
jgi:hypothetical protein